MNYNSTWAQSPILTNPESLESISNSTLIHLSACISSNKTETDEFLDNYTRNTFIVESTSEQIFAFNSSPNLIIDRNNTNDTEDFGTTLVIQPDLKIHYPILACFLALICFLIVFGNVLVMIAIKKERYLHTVTNYFIASLAAADCLVGLIVMPTSVVHEVMNKWWIFGEDWCDLWHSFDVLASTASILNLCVISLDRYWAITDPITYPAKMTPNRATLLITIVWTMSSIISFPAILWWRATSTRPPNSYQCNWTDDIRYLVFSSIVSFYAPLSVMLFVYFRIYRAAVEQTRSMQLGTKQIQSADGGEAIVTLRIHRGGAMGPPVKAKYSGDGGSSDEQSDFISIDENGIDARHASMHNRNVKSFSMGRKFAKLAKERKAAKTLGIVMGVFILCWLPFFITNVLRGICEECLSKNADLVHSIVTWLAKILGELLKRYYVAVTNTQIVVVELSNTPDTVSVKTHLDRS
ncbi:dopamine receptor 2-like protein, partial [Dinothrombium tinctorium]